MFADIQEEFSLLDTKFLEEIGAMKQKNLAVEILKKLLAEQVKEYSKNNLVKSEKFSEKLKRLLNSYINDILSNEEVIEELKKLAQEMWQAQTEGDKLNLAPEELAFYDAITKPQAVKIFIQIPSWLQLLKNLPRSYAKAERLTGRKKKAPELACENW